MGHQPHPSAVTDGSAPSKIVTLVEVVSAIDRVRRAASANRSVLVAVTGIDGCGKGFLAARIAADLNALGCRVANLNIDGWLNLPRVRVSDDRPAEHFYAHAIRFDEMFSRLVRPLRDHRAVSIEADVVEETDVEYRHRSYEFTDVDVIVLEGIYLLKSEYRGEYDLSIWIDCSLETALERAIARAQEGLPPAETVAAYRRIYFPAQQIHAERDRPRENASFILPNDGPERLRTDARIDARIDAHV